MALTVSKEPEASETRETFRAASSAQAVVHLGASAASMLIYQEREDGTLEQLDFLEQPLPLGRDIFRRGRFQDGTLELAVRALRQFQATMAEYGIAGGEPERVVATNIIAEATNADVFLNRLNVGCGLDVEPLDDGEMTRLIYLETQRQLRRHPELAQGRTLVVHAGPGNTRLMLLEKGRIVQYGNHRSGTHRSGQIDAVDELGGPALERFLREGLRSRIEAVRAEYAGQEVDRILAIGYEVQALKRVLPRRDSLQVRLAELRAEVETLTRMSTDERIRRHRSDHYAVDAILPAALINLKLAEAFDMKEILVPDDDYESALLSHLPFSAAVTESYAREVRQSALSLGKRYKIAVDHGLQVEELSARLFEVLQPLHQLDARHLLLLRVAAITHEVGNFITPKAHHKHSLYIIANSEIFGLSQADTEFVACVARYHRHSPPKPDHEIYADMDRRRRLSVSKLAAILRLADALERAHSRRLQHLELRIAKNQLRIGTLEVTDLSIEHQALEEKGDFFREVYGLRPVLTPGNA